MRSVDVFGARNDDRERAIQKLLGHKDLSTTALYTKVDAAALRGMLQRCHPRER